MSVTELDLTDSSTDMNALSNASTRRGEKMPPHIGFTSNVSPEAHSSKTGVSVRYAQDPTKQWFVFRISYGRIKKACEIIEKDAEAYYMPLHYVVKVVQNKKKRILAPLLPNLLFIYANEEYVRSLVEDTYKNRYLSFYYNHFKINESGKNPPLTIEYKCMMSFINATSVDDEHVCIVESQFVHYKSGDRVRIIDGKFKNVEGKVARVAGQQRVIIELEGLCLIATAYIPTAFIKPIDEG